MPILVQKYGGSSVADERKILQVAERVVQAKRRGYDVVVVVSAMGKTTDELLGLARRIHCTPHARELDMLSSVGERISMALLCMAIHSQGAAAISLTGSQSGIITNDRHSDARIIEVRPYRIQDELAAGNIVVVAGFQGMSYKREITTLGRGGSDTTAVALAAALDAESCEIYGDVDGVYSADPKLVNQARHLSELRYPEMQEMSESGARVLNASAVEFAKKSGIALLVRRADGEGGVTVVRKHAPRLPGAVVGVAHQQSVVVITTDVQSRADSDDLLTFCDDRNIPAKQCSIRQAGEHTTTTVVVSKEFVADSDDLSKQLYEAFGEWVECRADLGAVSLIGAGINQDFKNLRRARSALTSAGLHPDWIHTSSFRISLLLPSLEIQRAVKILHRQHIESGPISEARVDKIKKD